MTMVDKGSQAWLLREQGMKWRQIADELQYRSASGAHSGAKNSALGKKSWPPKPRSERGRRSYRLRETAQLTWQRIAEICHYSDRQHSYKAAMRYARINNKPWPLPTHLCQGQIFYEDIADGMSYKKLQKIHGYDDPGMIRRLAYNWAMRHQKVWPPS